MLGKVLRPHHKLDEASQSFAKISIGDVQVLKEAEYENDIEVYNVYEVRPDLIREHSLPDRSSLPSSPDLSPRSTMRSPLYFTEQVPANSHGRVSRGFHLLFAC